MWGNMPAGRPPKQFNKKLFVDLIGIGCDQRDICWVFRDEDGKPANIDTLSRWCKREFGMNFQEYAEQNRGAALRIKLRQNQMRLSEKSAAMAIFLGKQYLGQTDAGAGVTEQTRDDGFIAALSATAAEDWSDG